MEIPPAGVPLPKTEVNCAAAMPGGEQTEVTIQPVTFVNSIRLVPAVSLPPSGETVAGSASYAVSVPTCSGAICDVGPAGVVGDGMARGGTPCVLKRELLEVVEPAKRTWAVSGVFALLKEVTSR